MNNPEGSPPSKAANSSAPSQAANEPAELPQVMSPLASRIFLFVSLAMMIGGAIMLVYINMNGPASAKESTIATVLLSFGAIAFAAWIVIQILGRMVLRIMLRDTHR